MTILTKLSKQDFDEILNCYDIGNYKSHRHCRFALETTVYFLRTSKGKYVLKVFEKTKPEIIKFQLKIMTYLTDKHFDIPYLIKTRNKENHIIYKKKYIFIQSFFEGKHPNKLKNKEVYALGRDISKLRVLLSEFKEPFLEGPYFESWEPEAIFKGINLEKESKKIISNIRKLDSKKIPKGLIHGDVNPSNLFRSKTGEIVFIDWDDLHIDYYVYDLAVVISQLFIKKKLIYKNQINLLLKGYQVNQKLSSEELKALYYYIHHRFLGAIEYCVDQIQKHPDLKDKINSWSAEQWEKYKLFCSISLEEFLKIIKAPKSF